MTGGLLLEEGRITARRYKRLECGGYVREALYSCPEPLDKPAARAAKSFATSKAQQRVNQNNSKIKLAMKIGGNFGPGDLFVTLTFAPEHLPVTYAELQEKVRGFYDIFRRVRRKQGRDTMYIYSPHHTEKIRWHIHGLINAAGPEDWETIQSLWTWGNVHIKRVDDTEHSTPDAMAGYLLKGWDDRPNSARAWCASTNLEKITATTYREHNEAARLELPQGCQLCEADHWETAYGSYEYLSFFRGNSVEALEDLWTESRELIDRGIL